VSFNKIFYAFLFSMLVGCASREIRFYTIKPIDVKGEHYNIIVSPVPTGEYKFLAVRLENIDVDNAILNLSHSNFSSSKKGNSQIMLLSDNLILKYGAYVNKHTYNIAPCINLQADGLKNMEIGLYNLHLSFMVNGKEEVFDFAFGIDEEWVKWRDPSGK